MAEKCTHPGCFDGLVQINEEDVGDDINCPECEKRKKDYTPSLAEIKAKAEELGW